MSPYKATSLQQAPCNAQPQHCSSWWELLSHCICELI